MKPEIWSRRRLLKYGSTGIALGWLGGAGSLLAGCGGSGGGEQQQIVGSVNTSEIGGNGLTIVSGSGGQVPVSEHGSFTTTASNALIETLVAMDEDGQVRGLAISSPKRPKSVTIDAAQTAEALVSLTPGLFTQDQTLFESRIAALRSTPEFAALLTAVRAKIQASSIPKLVTYSDVQQALANVIALYANKPEPREIVPGSDAGDCHLALGKTSDPTQVTAKLTNQGWRYLAVIRRELDSAGQQRSIVSEFSGIHCLAGGTSLDYSSLFSRTIGEGTEKETSDVNFTKDHEVEYWLIGPGLSLGSGSVDVPPGIQTSYPDAMIWTVVMYLVLPMLGTLGFFSELDEIANGLLKNTEIFSGLASDALTLWDQLASGEIGRATISMANLSIDIVEALLDSGTISFKGSIKALFKFLDVISKIFSAANMLVAVVYLLTLPSHTKISLVGTGSGQVTIG